MSADGDDHDDDDYVVAETIDEDQSSAGWLGYIAFPKKDLCQQTWLET